MSIKTRSEAQRAADNEALKLAALTNLKRECARDLVPILRLVKQRRWVEASLAVDEYLDKPVEAIITAGGATPRYDGRQLRLRIFKDALKLRGEDYWEVADELSNGRKLIAIQLEKDEAQRRIAAQAKAVSR